MKKNIFDNQGNPFTVPDGYFDTLQERIMSRIEAEEDAKTPIVPINYSPFAPHSSLFTLHFKKWIAAAACILFFFTGTVLYMRYSEYRHVIAESVLDEDFYQWLYVSDEATILAESLDIYIPESYMFNENGFSEEDEAIIAFLERDNISVAAILHSFDNETFFIP